MRLKAISPRHSAFVSASAGSGKTKILIDRLVSLLISGVKPNKILCLAYTKAAANEIISRIEKRLYDFSSCSDEKIIEYLSEIGFGGVKDELIRKARCLLLEFIDSREQLNIQTIHSFAQNILNKFPFEAGINFNFTLLDENKASFFLESAKNVLLENVHLYEHTSESLSYMSWHIKEYSLNELILQIIENREKLDVFFSDGKDLSSYLSENQDEDKLAEEFIKQISFSELDLEILSNGLKSDLARAEKFKKFLQLTLSGKKIGLNDYISCFLTQANEKAKTLLTKKLSEENPSLLIKMEEEQDRVFKFVSQLKLFKETNLTNSFIVLAYHIRAIYQQIKTKENLLDYDDLVFYTRKLLADSEYAEWIRYKLDGGIDHILIDEAQDTSKSQWEIINKISEDFIYNRDKSLFIVGDGKQSIFSFQGAAPEIFYKLHQDLGDEVVKLELNKSFRSGSKLLSFVDKVFSQDKLKKFLVAGDEEIKHTAHFEIEDEIEIWPIILDEEANESRPWALPSEFIRGDNLTSEEKLAKEIACYIKTNFENPGDVMVLSRRRTNLLKVLVKELQEINIPVNGFDRLKLLEHPIVCDLLSLINFVLFPFDDFNLAIVLKSPIYGISEEELLELCYNRAGALWEQDFDKSFLEEIIEDSKHLSVYNFFLEIFEKKSLRRKFVNYFGEEVNFVLDSFLDLVTNFERENIASLQLFLDYLSTTRAEIKLDLSSNKNEVKIMTVHAAKGLQAKVVFLVDTTSMPHSSDNIVWLDEDKLIWAGKEKYLSENAIIAKEKKYVQDYAEYIRLLYVALTRAEKKLIITGVYKTEDPPENCWYSILKKSFAAM